MTGTTELLTANELAERLQVQPETVRGWSRRGLIPKVQLTPKVIRYDFIAVVDAMTRRQAAQTGVDP